MEALPTRRRVVRGLALTALGAIAAVGAGEVLGVHRIPTESPASPLPAEGFDWGPWSALLGEVVQDGFVRYDLLAARQDRLEAICARLAQTGPRTDPERFAAPGAALAYHLNAYNALVLLGVRQHWPLTSIADVHGAVEPVPHLGFFWALRFRLDGRWRHLYGLEHDSLLGPEPDARIHAAINCASWSCPPLRDTAFVPEGIDQQLDTATRDWARRFGILEADADTVLVHPLMDLYADHFAAHARRQGWGDRPIDFILRWLDRPEAARIDGLLTGGAQLAWPPYDWRLNDARTRR